MTLSPIQEQQVADTRLRLDGARIAAGYAHGELTLTVAERCWLLADQARQYKRAGNDAAAAACKERAMQILDEMGY